MVWTEILWKTGNCDYILDFSETQKKLLIYTIFNTQSLFKVHRKQLTLYDNTIVGTIL